jgi:hypothetical protein
LQFVLTILVVFRNTAGHTDHENDSNARQYLGQTGQANEDEHDYENK